MSKTKRKSSPTPSLELPAKSVIPQSPHFWLKMFVVIQLFILAFEFSPDISTNGDDAKYFLLGKSVISGQGYRALFDAKNEVERHYPPIFPLFLGAAGFFSDNPLFPKVMVGILSVTVTLLLFAYLRATAPAFFMPAVLLTALSSSLATHATLLMSEMPYLCATLGALVLYERYKRRPGSGLLLWATAAVSLLPVFIRTIGISFTAAWVVTALFDKKYKQAAVHALLFVLAMLALRFATGGDTPYFDQLFRKNQYDPELGFVTMAEMASRIGQNLQIYFSAVLPESVFGAMPKTGRIAAALLFAVPALVGWAVNFLRPTRMVSFYVFFYCGIICMWQTQWSGERFVLPLVPFLIFFFLLGIQASLAFLFRRNSSPATSGAVTGTVWAAATIVLFFNVKDHAETFRADTALSRDWRNFYSCADWVRLHTPRDAIVVSRKPELFYMRAQRRGFVYPFSHDVDKVIDGLREGGAKYVVLDNFFWTGTTARYLFPAIMSHLGKFRVVYSLRNPDTYILEFLPK